MSEINQDVEVEDKEQQIINERVDLMHEYVAAMEAGDEAAILDLRRRIKWPAWGLVAGKKLFGADFIRKEGYNTILADEMYGADWLDREEEK